MESIISAGLLGTSDECRTREVIDGENKVERNPRKVFYGDVKWIEMVRSWFSDGQNTEEIFHRFIGISWTAGAA
jgi:hypothetical protein